MLARNAVSGSPQGVYVYRGEGAGWRSVRSACESLQRLLSRGYNVSTLSAAELLEGSWVSSAALLVMPGGADLPYCRHLNGKGNRLIEEFVRSGGSYLGLCAGAYYACSRVEFEPGSPLQVVGDRELNFYPGMARGSAYAGFDYSTEIGAVAAHIQFRVPARTALADIAQQLQLQQYQQPEQQQQTQKQQQRVGHRRSGQRHHTSGSSGSWCSTRDYCNGGPMFVTRQGDLDLTGLPGVTVLATYRDLSPRTWPGSTTADDQQSSEQQQQQRALQHPQLHPNLSLQDGPQSTPAIGPVYKRRRMGSSAGSVVVRGGVVQPVAAVRCQVGSGVAVLCATHPELMPSWLDACGRAREQVASAAAAAAANACMPVSRPSNSGSRFVQAAETAPEHLSATMGPAASPVGPSTSLPVVAMLAGAVAAQQQGAALTVHGAHTTRVTSSGAADTVRQGVMQCEDAQLQEHTSQLRSTLSACRQHRDLFMSCLLYEALTRGI